MFNMLKSFFEISLLREQALGQQSIHLRNRLFLGQHRPSQALGPLVMPGGDEEQRQCVSILGGFRADLVGALGMLDGFLKTPEVSVFHREIMLGIGKLGINGDGFFEIADALFEFSGIRGF